MKCSKCGKEMSFENTTGRGYDIGLCESCEWDTVPADLPEAEAKRSAYAQLSDGAVITQREYNEEGYLKHVFKECSREHVLWWDSAGCHCTEKDCEVNHQKVDRNVI